MQSETKLDTKLIQADGDISVEDQELVFDPYNPINKEVNIAFINSILKKYGVPDMVHNIIFINVHLFTVLIVNDHI